VKYYFGEPEDQKIGYLSRSIGLSNLELLLVAQSFFGVSHDATNLRKTNGL
jgi:hypothetical protein